MSVRSLVSRVEEFVRVYLKKFNTTLTVTMVTGDPCFIQFFRIIRKTISWIREVLTTRMTLVNDTRSEANKGENTFQLNVPV